MKYKNLRYCKLGFGPEFIAEETAVEQIILLCQLGSTINIPIDNKNRIFEDFTIFEVKSSGDVDCRKKSKVQAFYKDVD